MRKPDGGDGRMENRVAAKVEIGQHLGRAVLMIGGQPVNPVMYCPTDLGRVEAEPLWRQGTERFIRHDVDIYLVSVPHRWEKKFTLNNFWHGDIISSTPLHLDLEYMDKAPNFVLERDPGAFLMIRFMPRPQQDWFALHPDELVVTESGERQEYPSLASSLYTQMAAEYCQAYLSFCESRPWAGRCVGYVNYQLCEGSHGPLCDSWLYDYSPVMVARWRDYLRGKYGSDTELRKAYGNPDLSLETIEVPHDRLNGARREVAELLYWQDAKENRPLRDYLLLMRELYHNLLRGQCRASRAAAPGKILLYDTFKLPMQGWSNFGFFNMKMSWPMIYAEQAAGSGNMDVSEFFAEDGFDGMATPYDYQVRGAGGIFEPEGIADSTGLRAGKLFFVEQDIRSYAGGVPSEALAGAGLPNHKRPTGGNVHDCGVMRDLQEFTAVTWRDLATALTRGFMNYMCDHNADYYSDPPMHDVVARQVEVLRQSATWPHQTVPGIAMILDEQASLETNGAGQVMNEAVMWEEKIGISRCGVPYRIYLLDDLQRDNFPEHRVYYFPNLYRVDDARLALLKEKVFRNGHLVVWGPGSGISDGETISAEWASKLTGFQFSLQKVNYQRRVQICDFAHPITAGLPADTIFGGATSYGPVLYPTDGTPLGWAWSKFGGDDAGLAVKTFDDYSAVFTTAVPLPAALWRGLARFAGAHVYCEENDVLMADSSLLALHSLKSGPRRLALPGPRRVTDLITGQLVAERAEEIRFHLNAPETKVFLLEE
ncbi:MAG: hypothetical protein ACYDBB_18810 [Armatimonadota bacterium]